MDVKNIKSEIDLKLNLLAGDSLFTDDIAIKPFSLREIKDISYSEYIKNVSILTLDKKELTDGDKELDKKSIIELILTSNNDYLIDTFADVLSFFMREDKSKLVVNSLGFIFNGKSMNPKEARIVDKDNFHDIVQIVKYQNCMVNSDITYSRPNPADEKAKAILESLKKSKEIISNQKKIEKSDDQDIDFADIVSAISTKSNTYNKHTVWDLTIYQLYDEYKRLEAISGYEFNIMAIMQGAKIENIKHWSSKIE